MAINFDKTKKRWVAVIGSGKQGTRIKKSFQLKRDAELWQAEELSLRRDEISGGHAPYLQIKDLLDKHLNHLQGRTLKYKSQLKRDIELVADFENMVVIGSITPEKLEHYLQAEHECSPYTTTKRVKHFKAFCKFIEDHGWLKFDGLARVSTTDKKAQRKRALTKDEVKSLLGYLKEKSPTVWHPIIFTLLNTGLRSKELIFLEWDDVDLEGGSIRVRPKPHIKVHGDAVLCKSKSSVRAIPISARLKEVLTSLPNRKGFVFPTEDGNHRWNNFYRDFMVNLKSAPLNRVEEVTPHVMRHTFISHLLVYGRQDLLTVSRLAGHASIETTQIYLHLIGGDEQKRSAVESLPDYED